MGIVAIFVFSLLYIAPGDPAAVIAGELASASDIARIHSQLGLDQPFLVRFGHWAWQVLHGDLGTSIFTNQPVTELIAQRLEPTVALTITGLIIAVAFAIPMGILAAWKAGSWIDRSVMAFAVLGFAVPSFVLAYFLILVFSIELRWFPVQGFASLREGIVPFVSHLVLPSFALGLVFSALIARVTRASMLEVLGQDYIRTAQAKGLSNTSVLLRHALKNAAIPIVTVIGNGIPLLISGVIVTETVFAVPGLGRLIVEAVLRRDYPVIQGLILLFSASYVVINLVIDLSYTLLDPRVRY